MLLPMYIHVYIKLYIYICIYRHTYTQASTCIHMSQKFLYIFEGMKTAFDKPHL